MISSLSGHRPQSVLFGMSASKEAPPDFKLNKLVDLLHQNDFGFVMVGAKPSAISFPNQQAWQDFEQIKSLFANSPNLIIRPQSSHHHNVGQEARCLVCINKDTALDVIRKDWGVFHDLLTARFPENNMAPESVLKALETENPISDFIYSHDWLKGIMLGYGNVNSMMYHQWHQHQFLKGETFSIRQPKPIDPASWDKKTRQFESQAHLTPQASQPSEPFAAIRQATATWFYSKMKENEQADFAQSNLDSQQYNGVHIPWFWRGDDPESKFWMERYREALPKVAQFLDPCNFFNNLMKLLNKSQTEL